MNPFTPSFGRVPTIFIDRDEVVSSVCNGLSETASPYQTSILSGVRGVGKTALLADICRKLREDSAWIITEVPSSGNILETVTEMTKGKLSLSGLSFSMAGLQASFSKETAHAQLALEELLKNLKKHNKRLLVAIDEAVDTSSLRLFSSVYQIMVRNNYPISLLMTGLPKNISELLNDKVLTFLLRSTRIELPMLNDVTVHYAFRNAFTENSRSIEDDALTRMTMLTKGYSYAFQLLGYLVWETGENIVTTDVLDSTLDEYREGLFRNAYTKIYEDLSRMDQNFLKALCLCGSHPAPMAEICEKTGKSQNYLSTYRKRLLNAGVITSKTYGYVDFSLPLFGEYLKSFQMP